MSSKTMGSGLKTAGLLLLLLPAVLAAPSPAVEESLEPKPVVSSQGTTGSGAVSVVIFNHSVPKVIQKGNGTDYGEGKQELLMLQVEAQAQRLEAWNKKKAMDPNTPPLDPLDNPPHLVELAKKQYGITTPSVSRRRKRMIEGDVSKRWPKGIVPYVFENPSDRQGIEAAMKRYQRLTCIRFVPWLQGQTRVSYGLDHDGRLNFKDGGGCWAVQGNSRNIQAISCCDRWACNHELGHALGMYHEHQNPRRHGWMTPNWDNIYKDKWVWYNERRGLSHGYDMTSAMHYETWGFSSGGPTMTFYFKENQGMSNIFYMFKEISMEHNCAGLKCPNSNLQCANDGYLGYVDDICTCVCPDGLDPSTGCNSAIVSNQASSWPTGSYSLMAASTGCPSNAGFALGTRRHYGTQTHTHSNPIRLQGDFIGSMNVYVFCTMQGGGSGNWQPGNYCILRKNGACPNGFQMGSVQFDDVSNFNQQSASSGTLPDGVYDQDTRMEFCCRDDGYSDLPLDLPNSQPLILFKSKRNDQCQAVKDMHHSEGFFQFANVNGNLFSTLGAEPYVQKSGPIYNVHYCHYRPTVRNCGGTIELSSNRREFTFTTPGYPNPYPNDLECDWLIKGPPGSTIILVFNDFEIEKTAETCPDRLNIRYFKLGQHGIDYCGDSLSTSIHSIFNTMMLKFSTNENVQKRGFHATARVVFEDDLCYKTTDKGRSYTGNVNFTRDFTPCLPWKDVGHCPHSLYDVRDIDARLEENFCRNAGDGLMPWCYTASENCQRDYCDPCLLNVPYNVDTTCSQTPEILCADPVKAIRCAKTCEKLFFEPLKRTLPQAIYVTCSSPANLDDAIITSPNQLFYNVGENVTYKCVNSNITLTRTCLTNGRWSHGGYVCGGCPTGWSYHRGSCYKYFDEVITFGEATSTCAENNALIAVAASETESNFIVSLREKLMHIWLGVTDKQAEGLWLTVEGARPLWTNWKANQPDNWANNQHCVTMEGEENNNVWDDVSCDERRSFVCKMSAGARQVCKDRRHDCGYLLEQNPRMCVDKPDFSTLACPFTCGVCSPDSNFRAATVCVSGNCSPMFSSSLPSARANPQLQRAMVNPQPFNSQPFAGARPAGVVPMQARFRPIGWQSGPSLQGVRTPNWGPAPMSPRLNFFTDMVSRFWRNTDPWSFG